VYVPATTRTAHAAARPGARKKRRFDSLIWRGSCCVHRPNRRRAQRNRARTCRLAGPQGCRVARGRDTTTHPHTTTGRNDASDTQITITHSPLQHWRPRSLTASRPSTRWGEEQTHPLQLASAVEGDTHCVHCTNLQFVPRAGQPALIPRCTCRQWLVAKTRENYRKTRKGVRAHARPHVRATHVRTLQRKMYAAAGCLLSAALLSRLKDERKT
jgi:hypothetical protein